MVRQELCDAFETVMKEAGDGMVIAPLTALGVSGNADVGKPGEGDLDLGSKTIQVSPCTIVLQWRTSRPCGDPEAGSIVCRSTRSDSSST